MWDALGRIISRTFSSNPIFLVGGSRSGTSALRTAIGQHPLILSMPSEGPFFNDLGCLAHDLTSASDRERDYFDRTLHVPRDYIFQTLRRLGLETSLGPHYGLKRLAKTWVREFPKVSVKRHFCVKCAAGQRAVLGLKVLYPGAHYIWLLRNGINVVHSRTMYPAFKDLSFTEHCHHWANSIHRFAFLSGLPEAVVVRHEDFVENPDHEFRRIYESINIPYHFAPTRFSEQTLVHPLSAETVTKANVKEALKNRCSPYVLWDESQRAIFKQICSDAMSVAGYEMPFN